MFGYFETPPEADTQELVQKMMSPNTLHGMLQDSDLGGVAVPKKRKHLKKSDHNNVGASNSQPPPRAPHAPGNRRATCYAHSHQSDGFSLVWKSWRPFHVAGETMLPPSVLDKVSLELKVLNDTFFIGRNIWWPSRINETTRFGRCRCQPVFTFTISIPRTSSICALRIFSTWCIWKKLDLPW
jgi:hypothetical protein